ncbi:MAG: DUF6288 domain-containing protein [Planctomycetota bacterium]
MKKRFSFIAVAALLACPLLAFNVTAGQAVKVYILAGQSNMEGHASVSTLDAVLGDPAQRDAIKHLKHDGQWVERDDVFVTFLDRAHSALSPAHGPLTVGYGTPKSLRGPDGKRKRYAGVGPELGIGWVLGEHHNEPVLLIKAAWGGRAIKHTFRPPSAAMPSEEELKAHLAKSQRKNPDMTLEALRTSYGQDYRKVLSEVARVLDNIDQYVPGYDKDKGYELAGLIWFQGWNDMVGGGNGVVSVRVPKLGRYSSTWPIDCPKSSEIIQDHAEYLIRAQVAEGWFDAKRKGGLTEVMGALFLLSLDDPRYEKNNKRFAQALSQSLLKGSMRSTWHLGYQVIYLSEYYLKTGDTSVLPSIEAACKKAAEHQQAGSWGHYMAPVNVGYVQGGLMNNAGVTMFLGLALARECGVTVSEEAFQRAAVFFYRMAGRGSIAYGDHRAEMRLDTNGRNAAIACAFSLIDEKPFQSASEHLTMMVAESYSVAESGHTGGAFNILWRGISLPLLPEGARFEQARQLHMNQLGWYYDLCRLPNGGFSMLPSPPNKTRYVGESWGRGLGLTYTAPMQTLRMTGGARTKYSKQAPEFDLAELQPWTNQHDEYFLITEHAKGYGKDRQTPHEIKAFLEERQPSIEYAAKILRHHNPAIRFEASRVLGQAKTNDAYQAIEQALQDEDPRVRRAACDAISNYANFRTFPDGHKIPRAVVSERFIPHIEKMLRDPDAAVWELDGALWALGMGKPDDIRRNRETINRYSEHEEWYLRESAYWAMVGLGKDISSEEFLFLAEIFNRSAHIYERGSYSSGITWLTKGSQRAQLPPETIAAFAKMMGDHLHNVAITAGYDKMAARHEAAHRVVMVLGRFSDPPYELIAADLATYMDEWEPGNQHGDWLIVGNKWQPGLVQIASEMGEGAGSLIKKFEYCLRQDYWNLNDKKQVPIYEAMQGVVDAYKRR